MRPSNASPVHPREGRSSFRTHFGPTRPENGSNCEHARTLVNAGQGVFDLLAWAAIRVRVSPRAPRNPCPAGVFHTTPNAGSTRPTTLLRVAPSPRCWADHGRRSVPSRSDSHVHETGEDRMSSAGSARTRRTDYRVGRAAATFLQSRPHDRRLFRRSSRARHLAAWQGPSGTCRGRRGTRPESPQDECRTHCCPCDVWLWGPAAAVIRFLTRDVSHPPASSCCGSHPHTTMARSIPETTDRT